MFDMKAANPAGARDVQMLRRRRIRD